jgi:putative DNA primase/helicase
VTLSVEALNSNGQALVALADPNPRTAARALASLGLLVFPLHSMTADGACTCQKNCGRNAGKHPRTTNGHLDASTSLGQVDTWWDRWPGANIGVATGVRSGIWVLDIDPDKGGDASLVELERQHGRLGPTWRVVTGGGGSHAWFRSSDEPLRSSAGQLAPGLDVRADGGYVVVPPSRHLSGSAYRWAEGGCPDSTLLTEASPWLLSQIRDLSTSKMIPPDPSPLGDDAGRNDPEHMLQVILEGQRNATLSQIAGGMRRWGCGEEAILAALLVENATRCTPPLEEDEVARIARSITRYEPEGVLPRPSARPRSRGFVEFVNGKAVVR